MIDVPLTFRAPVKTITDATNKTIKCSMCDSPLVEIIITHKVDVVWNVRATCPHCGDKSYVTPIKGNIRYMPANEKVKLFDIDMEKKTSTGEDLLEIILVKND